jgi:DNA-binding CsgD family transcriptional regulator
MIDLNDVKLAPRDQPVLSLLAQGCSNDEIASFLNASPRDVKQHLRTLFLELLVATKTVPVPGLNHERPETEKPQPALVREHKAIGFGLPCSHCHVYYPADMHACPICKSPERAPPNAVPALSVVPAIAAPDPGVANSSAASCHP